MLIGGLVRSSAFVAFACYTFSIAWGIAVASRTIAAPVKPQFDFHRFLASLGALALVVHVVAVVVHHANGVQLAALVYIRASPAAVAGVTAMWLSLLLPLSFALKKRRRLTAKSWRKLHYLGYAVWVLSLLHALGAGSDTRSQLGLIVYGTGTAIVGGAACWRVLSARAAAAEAKPAA